MWASSVHFSFLAISESFSLSSHCDYLVQHMIPRAKMSSRTGSVSPLLLSQSYMEVDVRPAPLLQVSPGQVSDYTRPHTISGVKTSCVTSHRSDIKTACVKTFSEQSGARLPWHLPFQEGRTANIHSPASSLLCGMAEG